MLRHALHCYGYCCRRLCRCGFRHQVMTGVAVGLSLSFFLLGLVISQARKLVENRWLN